MNKIENQFENKIKELYKGMRIPIDKFDPRKDSKYKHPGIDLAYSWFKLGYLAKEKND